MHQDEIKTTIFYNGLRIHLFNPKSRLELSYNSVSNIIALDNSGRVVWEAEGPKSYHDQYFDMELDNNNDTLIAVTGGSYRHVIDLKNGRVIEYRLIK